MKILYLHKGLLSHKQQVRTDFFGYRRYYAVANHVKTFLKNVKVKGREYPDYNAFF